MRTNLPAQDEEFADRRTHKSHQASTVNKETGCAVKITNDIVPDARNDCERTVPFFSARKGLETFSCPKLWRQWVKFKQSKPIN